MPQTASSHHKMVLITGGKVLLREDRKLVHKDSHPQEVSLNTKLISCCGWSRRGNTAIPIPLATRSPKVLAECITRLNRD